MRVGLIGCGTVAGYGHLPTIKSIPEFELVALSDVNEDRLKNYGERFGVENLFTDYKSMLSSLPLELVVITTPLRTHFEIVMESAKVGVNVLCEKPVAETVEKGWQMVEAMKGSGKLFIIDFEVRFDPYMRRIKEILDSGVLGRPMFLRFISNWYGGRWASQERYTSLVTDGMGPIVDCGVHHFDLARWFSGSEFDSILSAGIHMEGYENPDHVVAICRMSSGALTVIDESWVYTYNSKDRLSFLRIDVECEKGVINYTTGLVPGQGEFRMYGPTETIIENFIDQGKPFSSIYESVARSIKEGKIEEPLASGEDGVKATEAALRALEKALARR